MRKQHAPAQSDRQVLGALVAAYREGGADTANGWPTAVDVADHSPLSSGRVRRRLLALADEGRCRTAMTISLAPDGTRARSFAPAEGVVSDE